jgi:ribosomal protein S18 acetylase RimI-like enzyme
MQNIEPVIRPLRSGEIQALERLVAEMQDHERTIEPDLLPGDGMASAYVADLFRRTELHSGIILVAEVTGELIGFVAVQAKVPIIEPDHSPGTYALVSDLAVSAPHRGRGIGRALLLEAEEYARRHNAADLRIAVLSGNTGARKLYVETGFAPYLELLRKKL